MIRIMHAAAVTAVMITAPAMADPPHVVIESCEFLPPFPGHDRVHVTYVNHLGDFCGYSSDGSFREFEYINNQPLGGISNAIAKAMNDARVTVGQSAVGNPRGWVRNGSSLVSIEPNLSFLGVNSAGWILGRTEPRFGNSTYFRREAAGETALPGNVFWSHIDDEGTVYGTPFGDAGRVVRRTRSGSERTLGPFDREFASVLHVNSQGDLAGFTEVAGGTRPTEGLAVVGGVVHHIESLTGGQSFALAVMLDGQVIGSERGCMPQCRTRYWVLKSGVRHDLATEIANTLGIEPDFVEVGAASENGWVVTSGFDTRDHSYHLIRVKIRVDVDSDGDGLLDSWEAADGGVDVNHDGVIDLRPFELGARPDHKDVFVEVDRGTIAISNEAVSRVQSAFENAPVENPDGSTGIRLHILLDESGLPLPGSLSIAGQFPEGFAATKAAHFGTPAERSDENHAAILQARERVYRYCVLYDGIQFTGSGYMGLAEVSGNDFVIDLLAPVFHDGFRDIDDQASTFMHELGHTLGLRHGGATDAIDADGAHSFQGKPNYPSIMNYALTHPLRWNNRFWTLDYCREELGTLQESSLDESAGIPSTLYRSYAMPFGIGPDGARSFRLVRLNGTAADFDGDGTIGREVASDLNFLPPEAEIAGTTAPTPGNAMRGHNDWATLVYRIVPDAQKTDHDISLSEGCPSSQSVAYLDGVIPVSCIADLNEDGGFDGADVDAFFASWENGDADADFNADGGVDGADVDAFFTAWEAGGC